MIRKIEMGEKCKDTLELVFGNGDIMFHGLAFAEEPDKFSLGFVEMPGRKVGDTTTEFLNMTTDEFPNETKLVLSFTNPESVTAVIHSLIELQKRMFDHINEKK